MHSESLMHALLPCKGHVGRFFIFLKNSDGPYHEQIYTVQACNDKPPFIPNKFMNFGL